MHVLITTDTLSDVWNYTRELVTGLVGRGTRVTLISFGEIPVHQQTKWMDSLPHLEYRPTAFRLDWMQDAEHDFKDSFAYLTALATERKPDLLHLNHPCYGSLNVDIPRIVVAHGDFINWWKAVHGQEPKETQWLRRYRHQINEGLLETDVVVAPTVWMMDSLRSCYDLRSRRSAIIYHGRDPVSFNSYGRKQNAVLTVGRVVDPGAQPGILTLHNHPIPISIVESNGAFLSPQLPIHAEVKAAIDEAAVSMKGRQSQDQMRLLYSQSSIYAATSRYEPFGMPAVEAAFSRCAIVANDIPSFREVWGDAALYFRTNNASSLADIIQSLHQDRELCRMYANRAFQRAHECFTSKRMVNDYTALYSRTIRSEKVALAA